MVSYKGQLGGKRKGAGRPKGLKNKKTVEENIIKDEMKQRVLKSADHLVSAQMNLATGVSYLMCVTYVGTGKNRKKNVEIVENKNTIADYFAGELDMSLGEEYYYITSQKPENKAIDSLFDRTFGKAQQSIDHTTKGESLNVSSEAKSSMADRLKGMFTSDEDDDEQES